MLVLTRKENQRIIIDGGRIVVRVVEIDGSRVRLGFDAPRDVTILREEVDAKPEAA